MHTVFSHIIQKRFSTVCEDVATASLAYILESSESARDGMMKLLRICDLKHKEWKIRYARISGDTQTLNRRLQIAGITVAADTQLGPVMALTSWDKVLLILEHEAVDDPCALGDNVQLRALCDSTDNNAFNPLSMEEISDQRTPARIIQLGSIIPEAVNVAVREKNLDINGLMPQTSWHRG